MQLDFGLLSTIVLLLAQIGLGIYVLLRTSRTRSGFSFAGFCFSLSLWSFAAYMLKHAASVAGVELWGRYIFLGPVLIAYCFLYFSFIFPKGEIKGLLNLILAAFMLLMLALVPTPLILEKGVLTEAGPSPVWGTAYPLFSFYFLLYVIWGFYNFVRKFASSEGSEKTQIKYVGAGLFFTFLFGIIFNLVFPALKIARFIDLGPYLSLTAIGFAAYAIVKHRMMNISVIISRVVAEIIAILFLASIYLSLVGIYLTIGTGRIDVPFLLMTIAFGVLVGQTHQRLRLFIQTTSDKLFLRGKYDYYLELSEASLRVGEKLSLPAILRILYRIFDDVVEISSPRIFLPEHFSEAGKQSQRYVVYDKKEYSPVAAGEEIKFDSKLVEKLKAERKLILDPHDPKKELIVPCLLEDRLIAVFVLGRKLSEDPFTSEDIHLLEVLASQAAMALDHARSYEKIRADLEIVERQLARSQRLASLGTLTAGVTHEIRNPLTVIRSETERIANKERSRADLESYQELMLKHIDRIAGIVNRMLELAKEKPRSETDIDLNEVIETTVQFFAISGITLKRDLNKVPRIQGNSEEMQEVFVNLIQNSIEAMPKGGTLTLRTYSDRGRVVAEVSDTGKGIPDNILERIFDPFFSTRHEGVGLGLSIAYRIIRQHNGDVEVQSEAGRGTTFKITF